MPQKIKYPIVNNQKQCGDCLLFLPVSNFRKARSHLTSRCVPCLKIYAEKYRARPEVKEKASAYAKRLSSSPEWREKKNKYDRQRRKGAATKLVRNEARRAWSAREKQKAIQYKGGSCIICGYSKCAAAMDFHHKNPAEKDAIKAHWSFERNKAELDKCVLLCCRCHREVHAGEVSL